MERIYLPPAKKKIVVSPPIVFKFYNWNNSLHFKKISLKVTPDKNEFTPA